MLVKSIFQAFQDVLALLWALPTNKPFRLQSKYLESLLNIMNLGTQKNLHIDTLWEVDCHLCYVGGACFLTIYWQFQTVSFWKYFNKDAFRFKDQQEYTDQRVHCMNNIHPSIHVFAFFERRVFDICGWTGEGLGGFEPKENFVPKTY